MHIHICVTPFGLHAVTNKNAATCVTISDWNWIFQVFLLAESSGIICCR